MRLTRAAIFFSSQRSVGVGFARQLAEHFGVDASIRALDDLAAAIAQQVHRHLENVAADFLGPAHLSALPLLPGGAGGLVEDVRRRLGIADAALNEKPEARVVLGDEGFDRSPIHARRHGGCRRDNVGVGIGHRLLHDHRAYCRRFCANPGCGAIERRFIVSCNICHVRCRLSQRASRTRASRMHPDAAGPASRAARAFSHGQCATPLPCAAPSATDGPPGRLHPRRPFEALAERARRRDERVLVGWVRTHAVPLP